MALPSAMQNALVPTAAPLRYICLPSCAALVTKQIQGYCGTGVAYCTDPDCQWQFGTCDSSTTPAGPSTLNDPRPLLGSVSYDNDIIDCTQQNVVALTYDDGPYLYTNQLLDTLKQFGFHATFFMTGNNLAKGPIDTTAPYPTIIQRMIAEGHQVASHTWSHYSLSNITSDERKQQMVKNERAIANIIGKYPTYMRPPYSQCNAASGCQADMKALGYHRVYFDLDSQDYLNPLPTQIHASFDIVASLLANPAAYDYLSIQHDIVQQSVTNFSSYYFGLIQAKGWKGVTAGECLGDAPANWYRTPGAAASTSTPISLSTSLSTTTTAKTSTTSSSTSIKPSTSVSVPTAIPTCIVKAGQSCGTILPFGDKLDCQKSAASCYAQASNCEDAVSKKDRLHCNKYKADCARLTKYCSTCGFQCSSPEFLKSW